MRHARHVRGDDSRDTRREAGLVGMDDRYGNRAKGEVGAKGEYVHTSSSGNSSHHTLPFKTHHGKGAMRTKRGKTST